MIIALIIYCVIAWIGTFIIIRKNPIAEHGCMDSGREPLNLCISALLFLIGPVWFWIILAGRLFVKCGELVTGLKVNW